MAPALPLRGCPPQLNLAGKRIGTLQIKMEHILKHIVLLFVSLLSDSLWTDYQTRQLAFVSLILW
jgi:hypothetical protein